MIETDSTLTAAVDYFLDSLPPLRRITWEAAEEMRRMCAALPDEGAEDAATRRQWETWLAERPRWDGMTNARGEPDRAIIESFLDSLPPLRGISEEDGEEMMAFLCSRMQAEPEEWGVIWGSGASDAPTLAEVAADRACLDGCSHDVLADLRRQAAYLAADIDHALMRAPATAASPEPDRLLTAKEVSERLGVPEGQVRDLMRREMLPVVGVGRRYKRVPLAAVLALMAGKPLPSVKIPDRTPRIGRTVA